jgi:hypothetical protein
VGSLVLHQLKNCKSTLVPKAQRLAPLGNTNCNPQHNYMMWLRSALRPLKARPNEDHMDGSPWTSIGSKS